MSSLFECVVCGLPGRLCSRCRVDAYCCKEHQTEDWPRHQPGCGAVQLEGGRLRAQRDVPKGTVLIKEGPSIVFPAAAAAGVLMCVGCCYECIGGAAKTSQCAACGLPVCSEQCAKAPQHQAECGVLQRARFRMERRDLARGEELWRPAVAALRFALAARRDPRLAALPTDFTFGRAELRVREDTRTVVWPEGALHVMLREVKDKDRKDHVRVVRWVRRTVGVTWLTEEELLRAAQLVDLHAHETVSARPGQRELHEGRLFAGFSQLEHSCLPNVVSLNWKGSENPFSEHVIVAARDISKGEYLSKDFLMKGWEMYTMRRQVSLVQTYGFVCRCRRCEDPTELGEYVGSPLCPACARKGERHYLVVSKDAFSWSCEACSQKTKLSDFIYLSKAEEEKATALSEKGANYKEWLAYLVSVQHPHGQLHPMHSLVLEAKDQLRRSIFELKADRAASDLEMKVWEDVCRDLLEAMDALCPGLHEHRLQILLELRRLLVKHSNVAHKLYEEARVRKLRNKDDASASANGSFTETEKRREAAAKALRAVDRQYDEYCYGYSRED